MRNFAATAAALSGAVCVATTAAAQAVPPTSASQGQGALEEIIVTAQRRSQNVQDVPAAITAIRGANLADNGAFETRDIAKLVPSLNIQSSKGTTQPAFTLRGIGQANQFDPNQVGPVGIYFDDIYQSSPTTYGQQLYDLESVEVLRGPQGTLYGKNTTAGAINFISVKPSLEDTRGYFEGGYGNFGRWTTQGAVEVTAVPDVLGIRLAGSYINSDGFTHNVSPGGSDLNSEDAVSLRGTVRWKPEPNLDIVLRGTYARDRDGIPGGIIIGTQPDGSWSFAGGLLTYSRAGLGFHDEAAAPPDKFIRHDSAGGDLRIVWSPVDTLELTSISNFQDGSFHNTEDPDFSPIDIIGVTRTGKFTQRSEELHARFTGIDDLDLVVGGYYGYDRLRYASEVQIGFGLPIVSDPLNGIPPIGGNTSFVQQRESFAAFVHGIYSLSDKAKLTLGMRFTHDKSRIDDVKAFLRLRVAPGGPIVPAINTVPSFGPYNPSVSSPGLDNEQNEPTGTAALSYQFTPDVLGYVSYSHGYRAGADNAGPLSIAQLQYLPPERIDAYEIGVKSELFDRRLRLNVAGFHYDYSDLQVQEVVGASTFMADAGDAEVYGLDAEATVPVTNRLKISSTLGLLHSEFTTNGFLKTASVKGNELPFAPHVTWRTGFDWGVWEQDTTTLNLRADATYQGRIFFDALNEEVAPATGVDNRGIKQDGYWLVDSTATLSLRDGQISIDAWVKNLLDQKYYVFGVSFRSTAQYAGLITGAPRTFGLTARVRF